MTIQTVTFIGVTLSFIVGITGLWISIKNTRKTIYINSITASRLKYIQDFRNSISDFCGLVFTYNNKLSTLEPDKLFELQREFDKLKYLIILFLDPIDEYWDDKMIKLLNEIISLTDKDPSEKINELICITQYVLKLEWDGVKKESQKGILGKNQVKKLNEKYVSLYESHIKKRNHDKEASGSAK